MKSLIISYLLWLLFGWLGAHHFYLERDLQGVIWWVSFGGFFGFGWIRDFFMIPSYVKNVNMDPEYHSDLGRKMEYFRRPPWSGARTAGMVGVGYWLASLADAAVPPHLHWLSYILVPLASLAGVWGVGNIGHEEGPFCWPSLGTFLIYSLHVAWPQHGFFSTMVLYSTYCFNNFSKKWRRSIPPKKSAFRRVSMVSCCGVLYLGLWAGVTIAVPHVRETLSEAVDQLWAPLSQLWTMARTRGFSHLWNHITQLLDPDNIKSAYEVLDLKENADLASIKAQCRLLSMKWHPDKVEGPLRSEALHKFYEVRSACDLLAPKIIPRKLHSL